MDWYKNLVEEFSRRRYGKVDVDKLATHVVIWYRYGFPPMLIRALRNFSVTQFLFVSNWMRRLYNEAVREDLSDILNVVRQYDPTASVVFRSMPSLWPYFYFVVTNRCTNWQNPFICVSKLDRVYYYKGYIEAEGDPVCFWHEYSSKLIGKKPKSCKHIKTIVYKLSTTSLFQEHLEISQHHHFL